MSHTASHNACPDCGGLLQGIALFGRGPSNPLSGAAIDTAVLYYTDAGAKRSRWLEMLEEQGTVETSMCTACHRIFLYGIPRRST